MLFGMKLIFSKVLKRLCFYVCNPYNARMKKSNFCIEQSYTVHCDITLPQL